MKNATKETLKFVLRTVVLFGIPAVIGQLIAQRPSYAVPIGIGLNIVDKYIHHLPNEYHGLVPF
jgi:hypothetical protein